MESCIVPYLSHLEIMALFVLRKRILQTRMDSNPVGLDVWCLVRPFVYFHTSCVRTTMSLARLRGCAGWPEPSLVAYVIITKISCAGSFMWLFQSWIALWSHRLGTSELDFILLVHILLILSALLSVVFLFILVSWVGSGLWLWYSMDL